MKSSDMGARASAWLLAAAGCLPLSAMADPAFSWSNLPSSALTITTVGSNATANVLNGGRASVFFSDGSFEQALFVGSGSGLDLFSVASTSSFVIVANSSGSLVSFPDFSISNLDKVRTLVGFRIDGRGDGDGHAAFDRGLGISDTLSPSTPGSQTGRDLLLDFTGRNFIRGTVDVSYSHPLSLNGATPVGDLFSTVEVQMNLGSGLVGLTPVTLFSGVFSSIDFSLDVDGVDYAPAPVPLPPAAGLLGAGLLALLARRRQRTR